MPSSSAPGWKYGGTYGFSSICSSVIGMCSESRSVLRSSRLELLHLVRGVAAGEAGAQAVALDGVRQDDRRLARVLAGGLVGGVDLAVVVPAALERPDLVVGHLLDELLGPRVAAEEVLADERAVLGAVRLEVAVGRRVHQVDERAVLVGVEQGVPLAAPDHLDDVPAGAAELRLELLDDLAVAADRAVEPLQVAVDDERQVVQALLAGQLEHAAGLGLVHLAVAEERPDVLLAGVLDAAQVQVPVGPRLVDGATPGRGPSRPSGTPRGPARGAGAGTTAGRRRGATAPGGTRRAGAADSRPSRNARA